MSIAGSRGIGMNTTLKITENLRITSNLGVGRDTMMMMTNIMSTTTTITAERRRWQAHSPRSIVRTVHNPITRKGERRSIDGG